MSNMEATDKRRISILAKIRLVAKVEHLAKLHKLSRNAEVERLFDEATKDVVLTDEELAEARALEDANREARYSLSGMKKASGVRKAGSRKGKGNK